MLCKARGVSCPERPINFLKRAVMKFIVYALTLVVFVSTPAFARGGHSGSSHSSGTHSNSSSHSISSYTKKDGTYVAPSHATNPNSTKSDNWTTKGNVNPYTGKAGTKNAFLDN